MGSPSPALRREGRPLFFARMRRKEKIISSCSAFFWAIVAVGPLAAKALNLGQELTTCVEQGEEVDVCTVRTINGLRESLSSDEITDPRLSLDPLLVDEIDFSLGTISVDFTDMECRGMKNFELVSTHVDRANRKWDISLFVPKLEMSSRYSLQGQLFVDLGVSIGEGQYNASKVQLDASCSLGKIGSKINVDEVDLKMAVEKMRMRLLCLFPKEDGSCCPEKFLHSCNPGLAKTSLRYVNNNSAKFVQKFQGDLGKDRQDHQELPQLRHGASGGRAD